MKGPGLPTLLRTIADAAGIEAAVAASRALGGKRVYISRDPKPSDPLVLAVGLKVARDIGAAIGDTMVEFPKGQAAIRYLVTQEMVRRGCSGNEIATALKATYRWARMLRARVLAGEAAKVAHRPRRVSEDQLDLEQYLRRR